MTDKLTLSAPPEIWLQADADATHGTPREPLADWNDVSWCSESIGGHEVRYIRRDLHFDAMRKLRHRLTSSSP